MHPRKKAQLKNEAKKFTFAGAVATIADYGALNLLTILAGLPLLAANMVSTTISSIISYRLNKRIVFEGRRHGRKRSIVLYSLIIGTGIYLIQGGLLLLFQKPLLPVAELLSQIIPLNPRTININISKVGAGAFAGIWNYLMLRRFVFFAGDAER